MSFSLRQGKSMTPPYDGRAMAYHTRQHFAFGRVGSLSACCVLSGFQHQQLNEVILLYFSLARILVLPLVVSRRLSRSIFSMPLSLFLSHSGDPDSCWICSQVLGYCTTGTCVGSDQLVEEGALAWCTKSGRLYGSPVSYRGRTVRS